ncbi:MAG: 23S rRNA (uracil(1939)-C(5))-methyltransferase RlmD [Syntrophobacterales bacterium]|nr:MAG: 23S rRNA (uracil(1939)-C(5))-methyltransferase RlmD [Syntrophobacterales bacterium]
MTKVRIDRLAHLGSGVGRVDNRVIFVPFTAPGDTVIARITHKKKHYLHGEIREIVSQSPLRNPSPCDVFGICGGCHWQHLVYPTQLELKAETLRDLFGRIGKIESIEHLPIIPSPQEYSYRCRVQLHAEYRGPEYALGFFREASHKIIQFQYCHISDPLINSSLEGLRPFLNHWVSKPTIRRIDLNVSVDDDKVIAILHVSPHFIREGRAIFRNPQTIHPQLMGVVLVGQGRGKRPVEIGETVVKYSWNSPRGIKIRYRIGPLSFSLVNFEQNHRLIQAVLELAEMRGDEKVVDLFCGGGNFTFPLSLKAQYTVGIDENPWAIKDARSTQKLNPIRDLEFLCMSVQRALQTRPKKILRPNIIVINPPRSGCGQIVNGIVELGASKIIYISCDPGTLARDINIFRMEGYITVKTQPIDMVPQTYHIESVTLLKRRSQGR